MGVFQEYGSGIKPKKVELAKRDRSAFNYDDPTVGPTRDAVSALGASADQVTEGLAESSANSTPDIMRQPLLGTGALSPDAVTAPGEAVGPAASTKDSTSWVNPLVTGLGMVSQAFAQTPGQLSAGRMLSEYGMKQMEQEESDVAAQKLGYDSARHMAATKMQSEIGKTEAETKYTEELAKLTKGKYEVLMPAEVQELKAKADLYTKEGNLKAAQAIWEEPITRTLPDGSAIELKRGEEFALFKAKGEYMVHEAQAKKYGRETQNMETDYQLIDVPGIGRIPQKDAIDILGKERVAQIYAGATRYAADKHLEGVRIMSTAGENKLGDKQFDTLRESIKANTAIIGQNAAIMFRPDPKDKTKQLLDPKYKLFIEQHAIQAGALMRSPHAADRQLGATTITNLMYSNLIDKQDGAALLMGSTPAYIPGAVPPAATKPEEKAPQGSPTNPIVLPPGIAPTPNVPKGRLESAIEKVPSAVGTGASLLGQGFVEGGRAAGEALGDIPGPGTIYDAYKKNKAFR